MSSHTDWLPVARWECRRTLLRKDFIFSVLFLPILMVGVSFLIGWFKTRDEKQVHKVAVVAHDPAGGVREGPLPACKGFEWVVPPASERTREALLAAIRDKRYAGAVLLPADFAERGGVEVIVRRSAPGWKGQLEQQVQAQARRERAAAFGLDSTALARLDRALVTTEVVAIPAGNVSKVDRVAQAMLWVGVPALLPLFLPVVPLPTGVNPAMLAVSGVLFVVGMMLYVGLFALILSTIKDLQSTSKLQAYLYFLPIFPFWFLKPAIENPDALWVVIISQIPFFSPFLIPGRMTVGGVAPWEIALAIVLLLIGVWFLRRAAGVAFRVGMLMYGKELSLPEPDAVVEAGVAEARRGCLRRRRWEYPRCTGSFHSKV